MRRLSMLFVVAAIVAVVMSMSASPAMASKAFGTNCGNKGTPHITVGLATGQDVPRPTKSHC